jgi:catechol 2,3-dioxygenase-like lactoylglutathione lyase family enzyme
VTRPADDRVRQGLFGVLDQSARHHVRRRRRQWRAHRAAARSTSDVDAFHAAALAAGGHSDGPPGIRPHDRVKYYAAFVVDPDGNRIEAVTFPAE